jgi:predicted house-cleaning noncanonical NTP pyrophosphatase (MazG superfamily)
VEGKMEEEVRRIANEQGWSDATQLAVLIDVLDELIQANETSQDRVLQLLLERTER